MKTLSFSGLGLVSCFLGLVLCEIEVLSNSTNPETSKSTISNENLPTHLPGESSSVPASSVNEKEHFTTFSDESSPVSSTTGPAPIKPHISVTQWKNTERAAKQLTAGLIKKILPFVLRASENLNISSKCTRHLLKMLSGIKQMKLWAFEMLDSSGKLPNGVLSGTITSLGDFDECLAVDVPGQFQGRYCTIELMPPLPPRRPFTNVDQPVHEFVNFTARDSLIGDLIGKAQHYYYLNFRSSGCFPSTCSREDINTIAKKVAEGSDIGWEVQVSNCEIKETLPWTTREIVVMCVICFVVLLAVMGTIIDVTSTLIPKYGSSKAISGVLTRILLCFSFYSNTIKLLKPDDSPDSIKVFHGMKVITVMWVMLNHTYYYVNLQVLGSLLTARTMGKDIFFQFILNGFLNVETFFFISAVLVVYGRMKASDKEFISILYIFRRIWRLTPPFMFVIAFTFLVPRMGSGPAWTETVGKMVDNCKSNWWTNLLYFNNYVASSEMCMQWMWYIPVDTHLYLVALLVLLPIKHRPRLGFFVIALIFVIGVISTAVTQVYYELHPTAIYAFPNPNDIEYYIQHGYFKTYLHAVTYCVGMVVGYLLATRPKLKIPLLFNVAGWLMSFILALTVLYGVFDWNQGNVPSLAVSTLYTCTNKLTWSLALAWVTVSCFTGNGGIATSILSWSALVPFSRLTYMAYLVHPVIQHMYMGSTRVVITTEHRTLAYMFLGHVIVSYIVAYVFSQLFECPFMALEKVMFSRSRPKAQQGSAIKENEEVKFKANQYVCSGDKNNVHVIKITNTEDNMAA